ncbi:hypothetical protein Tco_1187107 [Tanacetum coccineum]
MVTTRNTTLEGYIDEGVMNWYLVIDVNKLKGWREGSGRFSRMTKLEFIKFYGDDVHEWLFKAKQFFTLMMCMMGIRFGPLNEDHIVELKNLSCQMYALEISPYEGEYEIENTKSQDAGTTEFKDMGHELLVSECCPKISLNALSRIPTFNTMIVKGNVVAFAL